MFLNALASVPFDLQRELDERVAGTAGATARAGLQGAGITKADIKGELHVLEAEGIVVALGAVAILVAGALAWWKIK